SRIRHTSSRRDWSSDVCSSDLSLVLSQSGTAPSCSCPFTQSHHRAVLSGRTSVGPIYPTLDISDGQFHQQRVVSGARQEEARLSVSTQLHFPCHRNTYRVIRTWSSLHKTGYSGTSPEVSEGTVRCQRTCHLGTERNA